MNAQHRLSWPRLGGLTALLALLGLLGNYAHVGVTFGVDFLFGSIFTLLAAALAGPWAGLASALAASSYTWIIWNHPYAIVIFTAETLWVALALRRGHASILLSATLYWLCLGLPLVGLFYAGLLRVDAGGTAIIALKQALNGVFNALVAELLLTHLPLERLLAGAAEPRKVSFSHLLFHHTVLFLMLPTLVLIRISNQREERRAFDNLATSLKSQARQTEESLRSWLDYQVRAARAIADLGRLKPLRPSPFLQDELARVHRLSPDLHNVFLADAQARTVAFIPPANERGEPTLGLDFSDRPYFRELERTLAPVVSEVFQGRGGVFQPIISISVPLLEGGRLAGFGLGAANLDKLQARLVHPEDPNLGLTILEAGDRVVVSTVQGRKPLERLAGPPAGTVREVAPEVTLTLPSLQRNKSIVDAWKVGFLSIRRPIRGTPWTLLGEYPMAPLRSYFFQSTVKSLQWMAGWYLLALGLAALVSRWLGRTPASLVALSRDLPARVERGLPIPWPESNITEVAFLIENFKGITGSLTARIQQINAEVAKNLEQERILIRQSRLAAMGDMINAIAHQWRQPLNALSVILANLKDAARFGELNPGYVGEAAAQGDALIQKMSSTIGDFRDYFRPEKEAVRFSARHQVHRAVALMEASLSANGLLLHIEAPADVQLMGFPNEYAQVLLNLIGNASEALRDAGTAPGRITISLAREEGWGCLRVRDNRGNLPEENLARFFDPYFTTGEAGTGIGLFLSRQIIEKGMLGRIIARNVEDGAEIEVRVPLPGGAA